MSEYLETAKKAALEAGKVLMEYYEKDISFEKKDDNTFVSKADLAAEKIILDLLIKKYPEHAYYSEEQGQSSNSNEFCWYIDPLDGTHNFMHKLPLFGVSIALAKGKNFILGVINLPFFDELYYAEEKEGSFMNGKRISVSSLDMKKSLFLLPGARTLKGGTVELLKIFKDRCGEKRVLGNTSSNTTSVAIGRGEFNIDRKAPPYDAAAGKVIVEEAGGKFTQMDGSEYTTDSNDFVASNGIFHEDLIKILGEEFI